MHARACSNVNNLKKMIDDPLNYYSILNVPRDSTTEEIRDSYYSLMKTFHPDKQDDNCRKDANEMIFKINKAYEVLKDESTRRAYHMRSLVSQSVFGSYDQMENISDSDLLALFSNYMANSYFSIHIDASDIAKCLTSKNLRYPYVEISKISMGFKNNFPHNSISKTSLKLDSIINFTTSSSTAVCKASFKHNLLKFYPLKHSLEINSDFKTYELESNLFKHLSFSIQVPLSSDLLMGSNIWDNLKYSLNLKISESLNLYVGTNILFSEGLFFGFTYNLTMDLIAQMHFSFISPTCFLPRGHVSLHYKYSKDTAYGCFLQYELFQNFTLKLFFRKNNNSLDFEIGPTSGFMVTVGFNIGSFNYSLPVRLSNGISTIEYIPITVFSLITYNLWGYYVNPYSYQAFVYRWYYKLTIPWDENFNKRASIKYIEVIKKAGIRNMEIETKKHGLIILYAFYGSSQSISNCNFDSKDVINVTIPIQALVSNSRLKISNSYKYSIPGFYDPCIGETKVLLIEYLFNDILHICIVPDSMAAYLPSREHQKSRLSHSLI